MASPALCSVLMFVHPTAPLPVSSGEMLSNKKGKPPPDITHFVYLYYNPP